MKYFLIVFALLTFSLSQSQEINFLGKWVQTKTEFYTNGKLENTEKVSINYECLNYIEFTVEGKIIPNYYSDDCKKQSHDSGIFKYNGGLWTLSQDNESYNAEMITSDGNKLQMVINRQDADGNHIKVIAHLTKFEHLKKQQ